MFRFASRRVSMDGSREGKKGVKARTLTFDHGRVSLKGRPDDSLKGYVHFSWHVLNDWRYISQHECN